MKFKSVMAAAIVSAAIAAPGWAQDVVYPASAPKVSYAALDKLPDWRGVWIMEGSSLRSGAGPALKGKYLADYNAFRERLRQNPHDRIGRSKSNCTPPGVPGIMTQIYPLEFLFTPGRVTINQEAWMQTRKIFTDGRPVPEDLDPTYNGFSVGTWDGGTLVVKTYGIRPDMMMGRFGVYHSDKMVLTERIHLAPDDQDKLVIDFTFDDPEALEKPWQASATYKRHREWELIEFICADNDRNPVSEDGEDLLVETPEE